MNRQHNKISVGGDVGGHVVAGTGNVVGGAHPPSVADRPDTTTEGKSSRLGLVVDVVGFGHRDAERKEDLQRRLDELVRQVVADVGVDISATESSDAGDARLMFLPVGVDYSRVLPTMISATAERLGRDNRRYRDRMRLRMAIGAGLVGTGPLGFTGALVVDLHRMVDSAALRTVMRDNPDADLALLVSQALHDDVIRPGHLDPGEFTPVTVAAKEFTATAWLRIW